MEIPATDPQGSLVEQLISARTRADGLRDNLQREREDRRKADAYHADALTEVFERLAKVEAVLSPAPLHLLDGFRHAEHALSTLCKTVRCAAVDDALFPAHVETALVDALRIVRSAIERARAAKVFAVDVG